MSGDGATAPDRGGLWPVPFTAQERQMIRTQRKNDRRNIPRVWYWRLLNDEDPEGTDPHDVFWESARSQRKFAAPIDVHLYTDWTGEGKGRKKGVTETTGTVDIGWSRAEARRLGRLLALHDDDENLIPADDAEAIVNGQRVPRPGELEPLFVPRPGDLYRFRDRYHTVVHMENEWLGASEIPTCWKGKASVIREDSSDPGLAQLIQPATFAPPQPSGVVRWRA